MEWRSTRARLSLRDLKLAAAVRAVPSHVRVHPTHIAVIAHGYVPIRYGVTETLGWKLAGACASKSAALAHSRRCGGGARVHKSNCAPPQARCHHACFTVACASASLAQAHGHGPIRYGVAETLGWKLADPCASKSAALAHSFRCGGGARAFTTVIARRPKLAV